MKRMEIIQKQVSDYYAGRLAKFGAVAAGVDWKDEGSQQLRFAKLCELFVERNIDGTILDYGCGYGALLPWLHARFSNFSYVGYDTALTMLDAARSGIGANTSIGIDRVSWLSVLPDEPVDYIIASGILNVKLDFPESEWRDYVFATLDTFAAKTERGFAFNALSTISEPTKRRPDLAYFSPGAIFTHCQENYSRNVSLFHDYPLYEFTVIVRK